MRFLKYVLSFFLVGLALSAAMGVEMALPPVSDRAPEPVPYFPSRTSLFVWRNWNVVPLETMAKVIETTPEKISAMAERLGLEPYRAPTWPADRMYITVTRRNWHLLPFDQLCALIGKTESQFAFSIIEDDFLWVKLGQIKPNSPRLVYEEPTEDQWKRIDEIGAIVRQERPELSQPASERFAFIDELSQTAPKSTPREKAKSCFAFRYIYSYFAPFGDPLAEDDAALYPDGLLEKLAAVGVNGVWLHIVLRDMAPGNDVFPEFGAGYEKRQANLKKLVDRAKKYGIDVYLYINEPRAMQPAFFEKRPEMAGVRGGQLQSICTSTPEIKEWIRGALTNLFENVPGLGGVFTISGSENLTTCASHGQQAQCPRCSKRTNAEIIAEINTVIAEGVHQAAPDAKVIVWDWGWNGHRVSPEIIEKLPKDVWFMSVSEWALPIDRGGIKTTIGEYSISAIGPGPRATAQWETARQCGLKTAAKVQFNTTWECGSVPYIPAMDNVAQHCSNLAQSGVEGLMMSWSLGGYPSPNLEIADSFSGETPPTVDEVLDRLAEERYGTGAQKARQGWTTLCRAFGEFPYSGVTVYVAPVHVGPANPLRLTPSGYPATMTGIPYDNLHAWRGPYPPEIFASQMTKVADGFAEAIGYLNEAAQFSPEEKRNDVAAEIRYADAVRINYRSCANQSRFVLARGEYALPETSAERKTELAEQMAQIAEDEIALAKELYVLAAEDSRVGFESTNQYFYLPNDLLEKIVNGRWVIDQLR